MVVFFAILIPVTYGVHLGFQRTFFRPSQTLALTKALAFDTDKMDKDRALYQRAKAALDQKVAVEEYRARVKRLMPSASTLTTATLSVDTEHDRSLSTSGFNEANSDASEDEWNSVGEEGSTENEMDSETVQAAISRLERRYKDGDKMSELTGSDENDGFEEEFFVYRQPR